MNSRIIQTFHGLHGARRQIVVLGLLMIMLAFVNSTEASYHQGSDYDRINSSVNGVDWEGYTNYQLE